ncbi:MAG: M28 family peptidase [Pirellulales bacterium]|nr:M28 family peptidase [Pirellulales bacterium]
MRKLRSSTIALLVSLAIGALAGTYLALADRGGLTGEAVAQSPVRRLGEIPFDGEQAYEYLKQICAIGPRPSGSRGMAAQQRMLAKHFAELGGKVSLQKFRYPHPQTGKPVDMANLVVQWHPERTERILLAAHYDTRPFPDQDPVNPRGTFIGANDGASGVALLMQLAKSMRDFQGPLGVDFVLFDGEELVFDDDDRYFLGSEFFSRQYVTNPPPYRYRWGVLLDMVADKNLEIFQERHSMWWPDTRPLVEEIWGVAAKLGVTEFVARRKHEIRDDHLMLHDVGKIPTCDVIDFDYPYWHTEQDTPEQCSALSLAKVGWVIETWLREVK